MAETKLAYWFDEETGGYVELAGTRWDGNLTEEELMAKALKEAREAGLDLSYGRIIIETVKEEA